MAGEVDWFNVRKEEDDDPSKCFTLGRLENKEIALERLNRAFAEGNTGTEGLTETESLLLVEGNPSKKEYSLKITGRGVKRIATIEGS